MMNTRLKNIYWFISSICVGLTLCCACTDDDMIQPSSDHVRFQVSIEETLDTNSRSTPEISSLGVSRFDNGYWLFMEDENQIEKKIDVLQAHYFTDEEIYQHEIALYKLSTPEFQNNSMASKVIRRHNARIVEKNGMSEDITGLYEELSELGCVLQFVRSGRVAITTSNFERVNEYLDYREEKYRRQNNK